jgi:hypothetical protein
MRGLGGSHIEPSAPVGKDIAAPPCMARRAELDASAATRTPRPEATARAGTTERERRLTTRRHRATRPPHHPGPAGTARRAELDASAATRTWKARLSPHRRIHMARTAVLGKPPNDMRISCRPSCWRPHKPTLLKAPPEGAAREESRG